GGERRLRRRLLRVRHRPENGGESDCCDRVSDRQHGRLLSRSAASPGAAESARPRRRCRLGEEVHCMRLRPPGLLVVILTAASAQAAEIDRAAGAGTNEQAVLFGDPSKPGPYVVRIKWFPGNMSRPHFHPNDRFFAVLSGTWWMGTGETF